MKWCLRHNPTILKTLNLSFQSRKFTLRLKRITKSKFRPWIYQTRVILLLTTMNLISTSAVCLNRKLISLWGRYLRTYFEMLRFCRRVEFLSLTRESWTAHLLPVDGASVVSIAPSAGNVDAADSKNESRLLYYRIINWDAPITHSDANRGQLVLAHLLPTMISHCHKSVGYGFVVKRSSTKWIA